VQGDLRWSDNTLFFKNIENWKPGVRYTLALTGSVSTNDGRELEAKTTLDFFAVTIGDTPFLVSYSPAESAKVGVTTDGGAIIKLQFSHDMDRYSVQDNFSVNNFTKKIFSWVNARELHITSRDKLKPWSTFNWKIERDAESLQGVPMAKTYSGTFTTDIDTVHPEVINITVMKKSTASSIGYIPIGSLAEKGLDGGQVIGIEFSKDMNADSMLRSVSFSPEVPGRVEQIGQRQLVYIPERNIEIDKNYKMTISEDTEDMYGLKMQNKFTVNFKSTFQYLNILNVNIWEDVDRTLLIDSKNTKNMKNYGEYRVHSEIGITSLYVDIRFTLPFSDEQKIAATNMIKLEPFFPTKLLPLRLKRATWLTSTDTIHTIWENVKAGSADEPHYYKLTIPGGSGGVSSDGYSILKDNTVFYIEVYL
jgi:hypothetical protein